MTDTKTDPAAVAAELHEVAKRFRAHGIDCTVCHGDCASANPPVLGCPVRAWLDDCDAVASAASVLEAAAARIAELEKTDTTWALKLERDALAEVMNEQAARIRELEAALRRAREWGLTSRAWDSRVSLDLLTWIDAEMNGPLPELPSWLVEHNPEQVASLSAPLPGAKGGEDAA